MNKCEECGQRCWKKRCRDCYNNARGVSVADRGMWERTKYLEEERRKKDCARAMQGIWYTDEVGRLEDSPKAKVVVRGCLCACHATDWRGETFYHCFRCGCDE